VHVVAQGTSPEVGLGAGARSLILEQHLCEALKLGSERRTIPYAAAVSAPIHKRLSSSLSITRLASAVVARRET
jgi:hypothetical protein